MLLFILCAFVIVPVLCIQIHLMLLFILEIKEVPCIEPKHSNTSHVIVYQTSSKALVYRFRFKYISCYCLSYHPPEKKGRKTIQIHLMLLFITLCVLDRIHFHFIQIHLMLLFISHSWHGHQLGLLFKYISCYCLSWCRFLCRNLLEIQIHLMLLFIKNE